MDNNSKQYGTVTGMSLVKSVFLFSVSSWINLIISIFAVIITTRIFSPDALGLISMFNTASILIMSLICVGFDSSYIAFFNDPPQGYDKHKLLFLCMGIPIILLSIVGSISVLYFYKTISIYIFQTISWFITVLLFVNSMSLLVIRYLTINYRMNNNPKVFSIVSILLQLFSKCFVIAAALFHPTYDIVIAFNTIGVFFLAVFFISIQVKKLFHNNTCQYFLHHARALGSMLVNSSTKSIVVFAIYSWPVPIIIYLNAFLTQIVISKQLSPYELGVYSSTNMFIGALSALSSGFGNYWSGFMFANYRTEQERITKVHTYMQMFLLAMMGFLLLFKDIIYLALGEKYQGSKQFFAIAIVFSVLSLLSETTAYGISISKKAYFTIIAMFAGVIINVVLCFYLLPKIGLSGAAVASAISGITMFTIQTFAGQKYYKSIEDPFKTVFTVFLILLMGFLNYFLYDEIVLIPIVFGIILLVVFIFKKEMIETSYYIRAFLGLT